MSTLSYEFQDNRFATLISPMTLFARVVPSGTPQIVFPVSVFYITSVLHYEENLQLQGIFLMYLYVGSIAVIIGIYIWVLVDSCGSLSRGGNGLGDAELGGASLTRFGSLKRAHISRARTAPTSFYIRVGALCKRFIKILTLNLKIIHLIIYREISIRLNI